VVSKKNKVNAEDHAEATTQEIVAQMTPLETGLSLYLRARPVPLRSVSEAVVRDHLDRYTYPEPR